MRKLTVLLVALAAPCLLQAQTTKDLAVLGVLKQSNRSIANAGVWHRVSVTEDLDLVLAIGSPKEWPWTWEASVPLGPTRALGVFLQERTEPYRVFAIATQSGFDECFARILRATATDTVLSCTGEKSEVYPYRKFVYDVRAKRLVSQFSYERFAMDGVHSRTGGAIITGRNSERQVIVDFVPGRVPEFRLRTTVAAPEVVAQQSMLQLPTERRATRGFGPSGSFSLIEVHGPSDDFGPELVVSQAIGGQNRRYRLPRSSFDEFAKSRPARVGEGYGREDTAFGDRIGPWHLDGETLWFGKTFYDGEGSTGIGGFGYFDTTRREFRVFTSAAIADSSVSALLVQPDAIWLALMRRGEYGDSGSGLLRFDRRTEVFQPFEIGEEIGRGFASVAELLVLATDQGITVLNHNEVRRYIVDQTTDRRLRVAAVER